MRCKHCNFPELEIFVEEYPTLEYPVTNPHKGIFVTKVEGLRCRSCGAWSDDVIKTTSIIQPPKS